MAIDTDLLLKLRKALPKGYEAIVRARLEKKYSEGYIRQVAHGLRDNKEILDTLLPVAEENQAKTSAYEQRLRERIEQLG